jgi:hypothetical protein
VSTNDVDIRMNMSPDATALEPHYRISELAERWKIGRETVRKLCMNEPGVIKIRLGKLKRHTTYLSLPPGLRQAVKTLFPFNDKCFLPAGQ